MPEQDRSGGCALGLHHGVATSNSPVLVHALHPRVAIMNNGTRKGGDPDVMEIVYTSPGLEDLWQIHFSPLSGQENTVPGMFIANRHRPAPRPPCPLRRRRSSARTQCAAPARAQRQSLLDQGLRATERFLHRDQHAQRLHQDVWTEWKSGNELRRDFAKQ